MSDRIFIIAEMTDEHVVFYASEPPEDMLFPMLGVARILNKESSEYGFIQKIVEDLKE